MHGAVQEALGHSQSLHLLSATHIELVLTKRFAKGKTLMPGDSLARADQQGPHGPPCGSKINAWCMEQSKNSGVPSITAPTKHCKPILSSAGGKPRFAEGCPYFVWRKYGNKPGGFLYERYYASHVLCPSDELDPDRAS